MILLRQDFISEHRMSRCARGYSKMVKYAWDVRGIAKNLWGTIQRMERIIAQLLPEARRFRSHSYRLLALAKAWRHKTRQQAKLIERYQERIAELTGDIDGLHNTIAELQK